MAINDFSFTLYVSTRQYKVEDVVRLAGEAASRVSVASATRDDHRVFFDFNNTEKNLFDEAWSVVVGWAARHVDALNVIEDAVFTLWCTAHADGECVGLALPAVHMQALGSRKIDLVISAYTQTISDTM